MPILPYCPPVIQPLKGYSTSAIIISDHTYNTPVQSARSYSPNDFSYPRRFCQMPRSLQDISSIPSSSLSLIFFFTWTHNNRISSIQAANTRTGTLIARVNATQTVSDGDMVWMPRRGMTLNAYTHTYVDKNEMSGGPFCVDWSHGTALTNQHTLSLERTSVTSCHNATINFLPS